MFTSKLTPLMCGIGLALAGGLVASQAMAHEHGGMMDHDMMEKIDTNHDGKVSAAEHAEFARTMFEKMDANHDGMVSKDEMEAAHDMHDGHGKGEHEEHEKSEHEEHEHGMHHGMMAAMDANHDGMVSAAEHAEGMKAMFDQADANHDGMLSKDEMKAAHEKREEKHERNEDKREDMKEKQEDRKESKGDDHKSPGVH